MNRHTSTRLLLAVFSAGLACWVVAASTALAAPALNNASLRGLQIGATTTISFDGADLLPEPQVLLPFAVAKQVVLPGASAARVQIEITLDDSVPPGIYQLRLANSKGITSPLAVGVDKLPQQPLAPQTTALPVALHGVVNGSDIQRTTFTGKKDERILIDVEGRRLGASFKPVVRLYDAQGRQVAWSPPRSIIAGDARCEAVLPADGAYTVELHDLLYRAAAPGFFRLKIGQLTYADLAFPIGVQQGSKTALQFFSTNLPADAKAELDASASIPFVLDRPAPLPAATAFTGAAPRVIVSGHPELVETEPREKQMQPVEQVPVGINGRLAAAGEEDVYLLSVAPGVKLRFDVQARRIGSPLDGVLSVRGEKGEQPVSNDDRPGVADPGLDYTVPASVSKLIVSLRDLQHRGGPEFIYRIAVSDLARPEFSLSIDANRINVPAGGTQVVKVQVERQGYNGPLKLDVPGLPMEVELAGTEIPAGATVGLLTLTASRSAPVSKLASIVGTATQSPAAVVKSARLSETPASQRQPWLRSELGLAVTEPAPIGITWLPGSADEKLPLGNKLPVKLQLTRAEGMSGAIRVQLLTTQVMPKKTIKENNKDKVVDDVDRALRLEAAPNFGPEVKEGAVNILVPADLPGTPWNLVFVAELLSADGKSVVASTSTPSRQLVPIGPLTIELTGAATVEGKAGAGETGKLTGKISRAAGFNQAVTVTLAALPNGIAAPKIEVPADKSEFVLPVTFPYGTKLGELKNVKLVATAITDPKQPNVVVRSNELAVAVNVVPGEKPSTEPPREIFEDDEKFAALLSQGSGQASLDADKHSGKASLKVTPDQRFNDSLPNLGLKVREKPGPGEYRYLRFAWKKKGGAAICLQLNHDGTWGPGGSGKEGAKFRYHAGPAGECYGASLALSDKLPEGFVVVTRDLFDDFGEFTLTGLAFSPVDGEYALFDHLYLGRTLADFESLKP